MASFPRSCPLMLLLAAGCALPTDSDSRPEEDPLPDPASVPLAGPCELAEDFGGFTLSDDGTSTDVDGKIADGVVPSSVLTPIAAEGDCTVLRQDNPYCEPTCSPGEACDFDGSCVAYPTNQDLGAVTFRGLVVALSLEATFPGNTYFASDLPYPATTPGELIRLTMSDGVYGPAKVYGVGVESLDPTGAGWALGDGPALDLSWTAPSLPAPRSEIALTLSIDQHGLTPGTLQCTFADTGAAQVPASVIAALVGAGVTGFPSGILERRTVDHAAAGDGCFDFTVRSPRRVEVTVNGHTPCVSDEDCPDGHDCDEELQTCH